MGFGNSKMNEEPKHEEENEQDTTIYYIDKTNYKNEIPENTRILLFDNSFNCEYKDIKTHDNISKITFGHLSEQPIEDLKMPKNLTEIVLPEMYNKSLQNVRFPECLKIIQIGSFFNENLGSLPNGLEVLIINSNNATNISLDYLPSNLKRLHLGKGFDFDMEKLGNLPAILEFMELRNKKITREQKNILKSVYPNITVL